MIGRIHPRQVIHRIRKLSEETIRKVGVRQNKTILSNRKFFDALRTDVNGTAEIINRTKEENLISASKLLLNHMSEREKPRFFFKKDQLQCIKEFANLNFSAEKREIISAAEKIINNPFVSFNHDNTRDNGKLWNGRYKNKSEEILGTNTFRPFLLQLCKAYCYTGEIQYLKRAWHLIYDWIMNTPLTNHVAWSSFAISRRLMEWIWAYNLLLYSQVINAGDNLLILKSILLQTRYLYKGIEYDVMGNHLLLNAECLFFTGILFPEFKDSGNWITKSLSILNKEIDNQVHDDGVHKEQSSHYHLFATNAFIETILLARLNGVIINKNIERKTKKMVEFLALLMRPDSKIPLLGDSMWSSELNVIDVICYGSLLFNDNRIKRFIIPTRFTERSLCLFGPSRLNAFNPLKASEVINEKDFLFKDGGYVVSRSNWQADSHYMVFDCGPFGMSQNPGHGHADALSFELYAYGKPLLIDPGVYTYKPGSWRNYFRGTSAHNTVTIDGLDQTPMWSAFKVGRLANTLNKDFVSTNNYCLVSAVHDGYSRLKSPVTHQRQILFARRKYWIIDDYFSGIGKHTFKTFFHFTPSKLESRKECIISNIKNGVKVAIYPTCLSNLNLQISEGLTSPVQGWMSNVAYEKIPSPVAIYATKTKCPHRSLFIIYPSQNTENNLIKVTIMENILEQKQVGFILRTEEFIDYYISIPSGPQEYSTEDFIIKTETLFYHNEKNGNLWELFVKNGTKVLKHNEFLIESEKKFENIEMIKKNEELFVVTNSAVNIKVWDSSISRVYMNFREIYFSREIDYIHITT
jgi:hypothetical protein